MSPSRTVPPSAMLPLLTLAAPVAVVAALVGCGGASAPEAPPRAPKAERAAPDAPKRARPGPAARRAEEDRPPNLLVIVWDTVRADRLGTYGYDKPTSPKLDAWAAEHGVVYERAVSPGVWTLPSHASLFTALPTRTHGVDASHTFLEGRFLTVAEVLADVGYDTYAFVANPYIAPETNLLQGFERIEHPWSPKWKPKVRAHMNDKLLPEDASTPVSPKWNGHGGKNKYVFKEAGPVVSEALFDWLDSREDDAPWFAFVNYMEAHLPRIPSRAAREAVMTPEAMEAALTVEQSTLDFHEWMIGERTYTPTEIDAISQLYDASLIDLDAATHVLLSELDARGLAEDTIVVLTSDHGENLGEAGFLLHKYGVWNRLSRVPLVIAWKGHTEPTREPTPVSVAHALAEAVELGDLPVPPDVRKALQGLPAREVGRTEGAAVVEFNAVAQGSLNRMTQMYPEADLARFQHTFVGMEQGPWKWVERSDGEHALYAIGTDPDEDRPVDDGAVASELATTLDGWRTAVPPFEAGEQASEGLGTELKEALEAMGYIEE